jgi:4-carboxymuconolactone decarboxylase
MPRVPLITDKEALAPEHHVTFDAIGASRGGVRGPFAALMNVPALAGRIAEVGSYVRFESSLPDDVRELTIIAAAVEHECAYEIAAHKGIAASLGVAEATIALVEANAALADLPAGVRASIAYARELVRGHRVSQETFDAVTTLYGVTGATELTATVGYYGMIASVLNAFEIVPT